MSGNGTDESVVLGIEEVIRLKEAAEAAGKPPWDPLYPNYINLSLGRPDDGDPNSPLRVACREAVRPVKGRRLGISAAAGNDGPKPGTILTPAVDPDVIAVGAVTVEPFQIAEWSSRGPTREGWVKPDLVFYGQNLLVASAKSDTAYVVKSGTSFATPGTSATSILIKELGWRVMGVPIFDFPIEAVFQALPVISRKPAGVLKEKENTYGFGMPYGDLLAEYVKPTPAITEMITPILGLGLVGALMTGMVRAIKR